jgi:gamma-glutamyl-gamma-aminobutyrate hydrolase PuuD
MPQFPAPTQNSNFFTQPTQAPGPSFASGYSQPANPQVTQQPVQGFNPMPQFSVPTQNSHVFTQPTQPPAPFFASTFSQQILPQVTQQPVREFNPMPQFPAPAQNSTAPVVISYRGHQNDKDGQGMFFDHIRIQKIAKAPTQILVPRDEVTARSVKRVFESALNQATVNPKYGDKNENHKISPPYTNEAADHGLLVIPGRARINENEPIRRKHEYRIIREALNRGQPILALCAGSWRLFNQANLLIYLPDSLNDSSESLEDKFTKAEFLQDVKDHNYNGGMLRLTKNGKKAVNNVEIHDVKINPDSLVAAAMGNKTSELTVNSVHWKAVNAAKCSDKFKISAISSKNHNIHIKSRQGEEMNPQEGVVEAFETTYGVPVIGIQWHPEGSDSNTPDGKLIKYMVEAGNAYAAKRRVLAELSKTAH